VTLLALALGVCAPVQHTSAGTPTPEFGDTSYVAGLSEPTAIAFLPDGRLLITQKGGVVQLASGGVAAPIGTVPVCTGSEMGLLGVAVDPAFTANGRVYFYRTESAGGCGSATNRFNEVVRATIAGNALGPLDTLLTGIRTDGGNHDGGALRIGPDGRLWVSVGDTGIGDSGGPGASTNPYAQSLAALEGKILRLGLDGSIPADNPFVGQGGARGEIWAYGFRNPFRIGFDPLTGALWAGDVGQSTIEEIDRVGRGGNHSWPYCEGALPNGCAQPGDVLPVHTYPHGGGASVTGGAFAVGGTLLGDYFFADFIMGTLWQAKLTLTRDAFAGPPVAIITDAGGPVDIVFGPDGALYYVAYFDGEVRRVTSAGFGMPPTTTTTTTTTTPATSTTTLPAGACTQAPTLECVATALAALDAEVIALGDLGRLDDVLAGRIARGRQWVDDAELRLAAGAHRAARASARRAARAVAGLRPRLRSITARRRLEDATREHLLAVAADLAAALRSLAGSL
jgi:glucose/arabinose dehydrogenase